MPGGYTKQAYGGGKSGNEFRPVTSGRARKERGRKKAAGEDQKPKVRTANLWRPTALAELDEQIRIDLRQRGWNRRGRRE